MKEKVSLIIALLLAMTSVVSAAIEDNLHPLAICFLVLCIVILIISIILPIVLYRRHIQQKTKGYTGNGRKISRYNLSERERNVSQANGKDPVGYYGIYHDSQPANSIYLPLDKKTQEDGNYASLGGTNKQDDPHAYEELKSKKGTFGPTYDNPVAINDDDDDDHDYEMADATIVRPKSSDYDNPPPNADTAF